MLNGEMISLPFIFYLLFSLFDIGTLAQLFSLIACAGLTILIVLTRTKRTKWTIPFETAAFILLIIPIIGRLTSAPIKLFNYWTFILPVVIFITLYILSMLLSTKKILDKRVSPTNT